jgi:uncharacterized protein YdaU (DUF1376 family)
MSLRNQPYIPLYVDDFLTDEKLNECSAKSVGVYIKLLCLMHKSDEYGTILLKQKDEQGSNDIENFALKFTKHMPFSKSIIEESLIELIEEKVLFIEDRKLCQKRMIKDNAISILRSQSGKTGGKKTQEALKSAKAKYKANIQSNYVIENVIENVNINNKKKKVVEKKDSEIQLIYPFNSSEFIEAWGLWKKYKKEEHKFSYKSIITEQATINDLVKIAGGIESECIRFIKHAITKGWKGLYKPTDYSVDETQPIIKKNSNRPDYSNLKQKIETTLSGGN